MTRIGGLTRRLANDLDAHFPELVVAYQDRLYSGVRSFVGSADAEDVTQEAFMRAHKALGTYPPERVEALQLGAWLWTISLNLCRNWARTKSRRPQTTQLVLEGVGSSAPDDEAVESAMLDIWRDRLATLPDAQRIAVVLRHVVGLTYLEIADATGRPLGTAKTDVHRGIAALRKIMTKETM